MSVLVHTARIGRRDLNPDNVIDVSRKSARPDGLAFAPSWNILRPALAARVEAKTARDEAAAFRRRGVETLAAKYEAHADKLERDVWAAYVKAFAAEMRASYDRERLVWERLLARDHVTLLCYCSEKDGAPERCHRTLLARDILPKYGATFMGEMPVPKPAQGRLF